MTALDAERVVAVHADDGLDECSIAAPTQRFIYDAASSDSITIDTMTPADFNMPDASSIDAFKGDSAEENAVILKSVLQGEAGPRRDVVFTECGPCALDKRQIFESFDAALEAGKDSIDSGDALSALDRLVSVSQKAPTAT